MPQKVKQELNLIWKNNRKFLGNSIFYMSKDENKI